MKSHCIHGHPYTPANTFYRPARMVHKNGKVYGPYSLRECRCCRTIAERIAYHEGRRYRRVHRPRTNLTLAQLVKSVERSRGM